MRTKKELDVDFIGGQDPLTKEEEQTLSEFFKRKKTRKENQGIGRKVGKRKRTTA